MRHFHAMPFGACLQPAGAALFRLWAPAAAMVELLLHRGDAPPRVLRAEPLPGGWHELHCADAAAGQRYQWRIAGELVVPDPASRCNPEGPHGPSELIDPLAFEWDETWRGRPWHEAVFYELHVGTLTPGGTCAAATERLPELAALGITALQLMPLADFPGAFGWGYDGVLPFAPYHGYGRPEELKALIQAAHRLGMMVFADVVYNHFGPDGNYLHAYAPQFFSPRHRTAWGAGLNFDGDGADTVREFFIANALYWLQEYRFDGLRLDAVHAMRDDRRPDILQELSARVRAACAERPVHLVLENDSNDRERLAPPGAPGRYDGQWNGDVHHTLHVLLTGERDGYYAEYDEPVSQLGHSLAHGFARQGGPHNAEGAAPRRAAEGSAPLGAIVNFLQNHDQVGNRAYGERLHALAEPAALQLAAAIVILAPSPPLLFMGEEQGSTTPFLYFADWHGDLRDAVREGRRAEFAHFPRYAEAAREGRLPDPCSRASFERCKLGADAGSEAQAWRDFYGRLLGLRASMLQAWLPQLRAQGHAAVHRAAQLQLRWIFGENDREAPRRTLQMRANLSGQPGCFDAASFGAQADGEVLCIIGQVDGREMGPWAGEWRWLGR